MRIQIVVLALLAATPSDPATADAITGIHFDWSTYQRRAPGSDNWPLTWCEDDHQYTSWGDGGGFAGTNKKGRVSLGFGRIEGPYENFTGVNTWGGLAAENPRTFTGKSTSIVATSVAEPRPK